MSKGRQLACVLLVFLLFFSLVHCGPPQPDPELQIIPLGGDFQLIGHDGKPFDSRSLRGSVVWVFFGYTTCPVACPTTLARLTQAREILKKERMALLVRTAFITVDPQRDDPARIAEYLQHFSLPVNGITGDEPTIAAVAKSYGAAFEKVEDASPGEDTVNHSTYVYLLDGQGRMRRLFGQSDSPERIAEMTMRLLRDASCFHNPNPT